MTARLLDGKIVAASLKTALSKTITNLTQQGRRPPCLAVILVGHDTASEIYVANKRRACQEVGMTSQAYSLENSCTEAELLALIQTLNNDTTVDGILVQLPLPSHINTNRILECISPLKDVDGFHPCNLGKLAQRFPHLRPCTPFGIIQLLQAYDLPIQGQHAVVIGASNIVGRPMALEFLLSKATVTICHRFTKHLQRHVALADIVVVATGVRDVIDTEWLQPHQILIDVGMHRRSDNTLMGDVNFELAKTKVAWITPVPGGVGPMTIVTLLQNTVQAATS
jgi:methylenetetrahydrofolate dehydrogenase (NADP+)/methenyltetrahydrofolate cyclohydrolase